MFKTIDKLTKRQLIALATKNKVSIQPTMTVVQLREKLKAWYACYLENALDSRIQHYLENYAYSYITRTIVQATSVRIDAYETSKVPHHLMRLDDRIGPPVREYAIWPDSKLRMDFAWPDFKICIEVQGGIDIPGRRSGHVSREGMRRDMWKLNKAQSYGWILLQFPPEVCLNQKEWDLYGKVVLSRVIALRLKALEAA